jgi:hypothetical protein
MPWAIKSFGLLISSFFYFQVIFIRVKEAVIPPPQDFRKMEVSLYENRYEDKLLTKKQ